MNSQKTILLTIDVEDWFQVENLRPWIPFETWDQQELRVERNVHRLLDLFDSFEVSHSAKSIAHRVNDITDSKTAINLDDETNHDDIEDFHRRRIVLNHFHPESDPGTEKSQKSCKSCPKEIRKKRIQSTFFILGWIAERLPHLVREIYSRGHEVASHGYNHNLCNQQSTADLKKELIDSKKLLEDITGSRVGGFRAPNFSIDDDTLKAIEDCGYLYDSSYNSFSLNARYGKISLNGHCKKGIALQILDSFFELPISNIMLKGRVFPLGGGGYFRLIPFPLFRHGVQSILRKDGTYVFYTHPWEIDSDQPIVKNASAISKFKHYSNLSKSQNKLQKLIEAFPKCQFITCIEYLKIPQT